MSDLVSDPILDALLAADGCPYKGGTAESVIWMLGYKTGLERAKRELDKAVAELDPHPPTNVQPPRRPRRPGVAFGRSA